LVQMKVQGLMFDPIQNSYIVVMQDEEKNELLPIWIGRSEANAINLALEGIFPNRPLTHDLISNIVDKLDAKIISIVLTDIRDSTYYSKIHLSYNDAEITLDARPSDSIALALRANAPIFAHEALMKKTDDFSQWLEGLKPEDVGDDEN